MYICIPNNKNMNLMCFISLGWMLLRADSLFTYAMHKFKRVKSSIDMHYICKFCVSLFFMLYILFMWIRRFVSQIVSYSLFIPNFIYMQNVHFAIKFNITVDLMERKNATLYLNERFFPSSNISFCKRKWDFV